MVWRKSSLTDKHTNELFIHLTSLLHILQYITLYFFSTKICTFYSTLCQYIYLLVRGGKMVSPWFSIQWFVIYMNVFFSILFVLCIFVGYNCWLEVIPTIENQYTALLIYFQGWWGDAAKINPHIFHTYNKSEAFH